MNQKDEEKLIIHYFRKHYPDFPKGRLIPSESPDFILKVSPRRSIGIELTRMGQEEDPVAAIREAIERKEEKLHLYTHMHLSELWLIIHADDANAIVSWNVDNKISKLEPSSSFDHLFFVDLFSGRVIEMGV
jgi:hypothetical protein